LEFTESGGEIEIFYIDAEGTSFALKDKEAALRLVQSLKETDSLLLQEELEELLAKS
jgi:hypothetical protein